MVNTGSGSPVMAIIESLTASECRMRSVNPFTIGATVEFSLTMHGLPPLPISGAIASSTKNGPRFSYIVSLRNSPAQAAAIARANDVARSRAMSHADVKTDNGLTRASVRLPVDFELHYKAPQREARVARAINISTGGLYMNTRDEIAVGSALELDLPLGDGHIKVHGRIVAHQSASPNYNIAFYDVDAPTRDALARFIASRS